MRVPGIAWWPGRIQPALTSELAHVPGRRRAAQCESGCEEIHRDGDAHLGRRPKLSLQYLAFKDRVEYYMSCKQTSEPTAFFSAFRRRSIHFTEARQMKLLVKVIETESSDAAQIAIVNMTWDFLVNARISVNEAELMSHELKAPVSLRIDNNEGEYFMVRRQDLPDLIQAEGRIADWDEFNHVVLEEERWSCNWKKIELGGRCTVVDQTGIYFKGTDSNGVDYVTTALVGTDLASIQLPEHAHAVGAAAE